MNRAYREDCQRRTTQSRKDSVRTPRRANHRIRCDLRGYDHLSESEREVTGLTFALAGYLVHDVHETVPFMLLDSLEAIDSNRLADLVTHFSEYVQFLVVALLPEDA